MRFTSARYEPWDNPGAGCGRWRSDMSRDSRQACVRGIAMWCGFCWKMPIFGVRGRNIAPGSTLRSGSPSRSACSLWRRRSCGSFRRLKPWAIWPKPRRTGVVRRFEGAGQQASESEAATLSLSDVAEAIRRDSGDGGPQALVEGASAEDSERDPGPRSGSRRSAWIRERPVDRDVRSATCWKARAITVGFSGFFPRISGGARAGAVSHARVSGAGG